jgi:hypothetical protein
MDTSMGYNSLPVAPRDIIGRNHDDTKGDPPTRGRADFGVAQGPKELTV